LGKYYPAAPEPDAHTDSKPDPFGFAIRHTGNAGTVPDVDICVSDCELNAFAKIGVGSRRDLVCDEQSLHAG
jgi:hypothetical protein